MNSCHKSDCYLNRGRSSRFVLWWPYVPIRLVGNLVFHLRPCLLVWSNYRWFACTTILTIGIFYLLYVFTHNALLKYCHWYVYWNGKFGLSVKHLDHDDTCYTLFLSMGFCKCWLIILFTLFSIHLWFL